MRRAPEELDMMHDVLEAGDRFAGGTIARVTFFPDVRELTIDLTDGSFLTYVDGRPFYWELKTAVFVAGNGMTPH